MRGLALMEYFFPHYNCWYCVQYLNVYVQVCVSVCVLCYECVCVCV